MDEDWRAKALCKGMNLIQWRNLPKALCFACPVRKPCLKAAIFDDDIQMSSDYFVGGSNRETLYGFQPYLTRGGVMAPERRRVYKECNGDLHKTYETLVALHIDKE